MLALVTGAAGFIGSNLSEELLRNGWSVRGVDSFDPYYDPSLKRANVTSLDEFDAFDLREQDLLQADLDQLLEGVDVVFHQAGQPGVRASWSQGFDAYVRMNVQVTQRLLEAVRRHPVSRFVYASSSSIYGRSDSWPTLETAEFRPYSPYGVTKLAGELLCGAYTQNFGIPAIALRYFTVYGPRQRPDMAIHRLIEAARQGSSFPLYGAGEQIRDFTFVGDVVRANLLAATAELEAGTSLNIAGGGSTRLLDLVTLVGDVVGAPVSIDWLPAEAGDVERTGGGIERASRVLGWAPAVTLEDGIRRQVEWHKTARIETR